MKWNRIPSPLTKPILLIGNKGKNDVWVTDKQMSVFHWDGIQWRTFHFPNYKNILRAEYFYQDGSMIFAITDKNYHTSYYRFAASQWRRLPLVLETRTQYSTFTSDSLLYFWGDWGSLVRVKKDRWEKIETPFNNHIVDALEVARGELLLSVRTEGVYRYDGSSFKPTLMPEQFRGAVDRFIKTKTHVYGITGLRQVLELDNNEWKVSAASIADIDVQYAEKKFGFSRIYRQSADTNSFFVDVPRTFKVESHAFGRDGSLLLTSESGMMYIGEKTEQGYFVDVTSSYNVISNPEYPVISILGANANDDDLIDIVTFTRHRSVNGTVFFNNGDAPFSTEFRSGQMEFTENFLACVAADVNDDRLSDYITARVESDGIHIEMYEQDAQGKISHTVTIHADQLHYAHRLTSMSVFDYDFDGDNDLLLTFYHNKNSQKGFVLGLKNSLWGRSFDVDTSFVSSTKGWNVGLQIADVYGNATPELIVQNRWGDNIVLTFQSNQWKPLLDESLSPLLKTNIRASVFTDVDLDGDTDVLTLSDSSSVLIIRNDNKQKFTISTVSTETLISGLYWRYISVADVTNDGYPDLLLGSNERGYVLENKQGRYFENTTLRFNIDSIAIDPMLIRDFDNDGDVDIFGYRSTGSVLYQNTVNPVAVIRASLANISPVTCILIEKDSLGKSIFCGSQNNYLTPDVRNFSFTGMPGKKYQLLVLMQNDSIVYDDLKIGDRIIINRKSGLTTVASSVSGSIFRFLVRTENQLTIALVCISIAVVWIGLRIGAAQFRWETNIQLWFISGNMFVFWILTVGTYNEESSLKFFLPLLAVLLGSALPLVLYFVVHKKILMQESEKALQYRLLETVIEFMHGQWAIKNLNGLMLYCSDIAEMSAPDLSMIEQLNQRKAMFFEMTLPRLEAMCTLAEKTGIYSEIAHDIRKRLDVLRSVLLSHSWTEKTQLSSISNGLKSLKYMITDYRDKVLKEYSCMPDTVIEQVAATLRNEFVELHAVSIQTTLLKDSGKVLIKSFELADIIDNGIRNAVRAAAHHGNSYTSILVYRLSPKICIDIVDNGIGIPQEKWERIFQKGYSEHHSTGLGLALAQETLSRYGGRMFVKKSTPNEGTTFTIELNEVP